MVIVTFRFIHESGRTSINRVDRIKHHKRMPTRCKRLHCQLNQLLLILFKFLLVAIHKLILLRHTEIAVVVFVDDQHVEVFEIPDFNLCFEDVREGWHHLNRKNFTDTDLISQE